MSNTSRKVAVTILFVIVFVSSWALSFMGSFNSAFGGDETMFYIGLVAAVLSIVVYIFYIKHLGTSREIFFWILPVPFLMTIALLGYLIG